MCFEYIEALAYGFLGLKPAEFYELTLSELFRMIRGRTNYEQLKNGKNPFVSRSMRNEDIEYLKELARRTNGR